MNDRAGTSGLFELGRRLERLLYVGAVMLVLCFFELYFVSATIYARSERPEGVGELVSKFEANSARLSSLFEASQKPLEVTRQPERDARYSETRRRLGLPEPLEPADPPKETYGGAISKLVASVSTESRLNIAGASGLIDTQKPPEEILIRLRQHYQDLLKKPITVWGIETPLIVPVQYGTAQYQVPNSFIANALLVGLAPLLIAWFGSVYVTRQRELLILRELRDHRFAFPHVLNILPVVFTSFQMLLSVNRYKNIRTQTMNQTVGRFASSTVRSFVLLLFVAPMGLIFCYSAGQLILIHQSVTLVEIVLVLFVAGCLSLQTILLVGQEWVFLWGKEYYA